MELSGYSLGTSSSCYKVRARIPWVPKYRSSLPRREVLVPFLAQEVLPTADLSSTAGDPILLPCTPHHPQACTPYLMPSKVPSEVVECLASLFQVHSKTA